jgi:hypothetical protein
METITLNNSENRITSRDIKMIQINSTHCVYKVTSSYKLEKFYDTLEGQSSYHSSNGSVSVVQGLCLLVDFYEYISIGDTDLPSEGDKTLILSQGHIDLFSQYGFTVFLDDKSFYLGDVAFTSKDNAMISFEMPSFNISDYSPSKMLDYQNLSHYNIFDVIEKHPELSQSLYTFDYKLQIIKDLNGDYLPLGIIYTDTFGFLSSKKYDLNLVTEWIKSNSNVVVLSIANNLSMNQDNFVSKLPNWDNSGKDEETIEFYIKFNKDEYNILMNIVNSCPENNIDIYEAIWNTDLINLNNCANFSKSYFDAK